MPVTHSTRGSTELIRLDFLSSVTVAAQQVSLVGSPPVDHGLFLDGATQYALINQSFQLGDFWSKIVFTPDFDLDDGLHHYFYSSGSYAVSGIHLRKGNANELIIYYKNTYVVATLGNVSPYWNDRQQNTLIVRFGLGIGNRALYLNGTKLTVSQNSVTTVPQMLDSLYIGTRSSIIYRFSGIIQQLILGCCTLTDLDAAKLYDNDLGEELRADKALVNLPTRRVAFDPGGLGPDTVTDGDMAAVGTAAWATLNGSTLSKVTSAPLAGQALLMALPNVLPSDHCTQSGGGFASTLGTSYRMTGKIRARDQASIDNSSPVIYPAGWGWSSPTIALPETLTWSSFSEDFVAVRTAWSAFGAVNNFNDVGWEFKDITFHELGTVDFTPNAGSLGSAADAVLGADGMLVTDRPTLLVPKGFGFDGTDDLMTMASSASLSFGDGATDDPFSITALADIQDNDFTIISKMGGSSATYEYYFGTDSTGDLEARLYSGILVATNYIGRRFSAIAVTKGLHHFAFTYDGAGVIKLFIDGVRVDDAAVAGEGGYTAMNARGANVLIGLRHALYSDGIVSEPAIWPFELSPLQVGSAAAMALAEQQI